jgi:hypothetical protein
METFSDLTDPFILTVNPDHPPRKRSKVKVKIEVRTPTKSLSFSPIGKAGPVIQ